MTEQHVTPDTLADRPEHIARQVGHNDGGVLILRRYRHLFESEARPMVAALDALLRGDDREALEA